ncbi:HD domain-containing protein [Patescibacteria group bacterium]|nr:HD domain-containing protein [Patescibacteria group bacterium]
MPTETTYRTGYFLNLSEKISNIKSESEQEKIKQLMLILRDHDHFTFEHSLRVAHFAYLLAVEVGLDANLRNDIFKSAMLHDIGKLFVPPEIINRKSDNYLSKREHDLLVAHGKMGAELLEELSFPEFYSLVADQHWMGENKKDPPPQDLANRHWSVPYVTIADVVASGFEFERKSQPDYKPEKIVKFINDRLDRNIFPRELKEPFNRLMFHGRHSYWYGRSVRNEHVMHR